MNNSLCKLLAASCVIAATASPADAGACELNRDQFGILRGKDCNLADFDKKLMVVVHQPKYALNLPNLVPDRMHYWVAGTSVEASVEVENVSMRNAGAHNTHVVFSVSNARSGLQIPGSPFMSSARFGPIGATQSQAKYMATIDLPDTHDDYDIVAMISVDSPTQSRPVGEVWEQNETDNTVTKNCRVYGYDDPDATVGPCD